MSIVIDLYEKIGKKKTFFIVWTVLATVIFGGMGLLCRSVTSFTYEGNRINYVHSSKDLHEYVREDNVFTIIDVTDSSDRYANINYKEFEIHFNDKTIRAFVKRNFLRAGKDGRKHDNKVRVYAALQAEKKHFTVTPVEP